MKHQSQIHSIYCLPLRDGKIKFAPVKDGFKKYKVGDKVEFKEWNPRTQAYSGWMLPALEITAVFEGRECNLPDGLILLGFK